MTVANVNLCERTGNILDLRSIWLEVVSVNTQYLDRRSSAISAWLEDLTLVLQMTVRICGQSIHIAFSTANGYIKHQALKQTCHCFQCRMRGGFSIDMPVVLRIEIEPVIQYVSTRLPYPMCFVIKTCS